MNLSQKALQVKCIQHKRGICYLSLDAKETLNKRAACDLCIKYIKLPTSIQKVDELLGVLKLSTLQEFSELKQNILKYLESLEKQIHDDLQQISQYIVPPNIISYYLNQSDLNLEDFQQLGELLSKICDDRDIKHEQFSIYQEIRVINKKLNIFEKELHVLAEYTSKQPIYQYIEMNPKQTYAKTEEILKKQDQIKLQLISQLQQHTSNVLTVQLTEKHAVSGSCDTNIKVWNLLNNKCQQTIQVNQVIYCIGLAIDGNILAAGCDDQQIRIWTRDQVFKPYSFKQIIKCPNSKITGIQFNKISNSSFVSSGMDGSVIVWVLNNDQFQERQVLKCDSPICCIAFNKDYMQLAAGTNGRKIIIWQSISNDFILAQQLSQASQYYIQSICFSRIRDILASASSDKKIRLFSMDQLKQYYLLQVLEFHTDAIWSLKFKQECDILISGGQDGYLVIWNINESGLYYLQKNIHQNGTIHQLDIYSNIIAVGLEDRLINLYKFC